MQKSQPYKYKKIILSMLFAGLTLSACSESAPVPESMDKNVTEVKQMADKSQEVVTKVPALSSEKINMFKNQLTKDLKTALEPWETKEYATESDRANALFDAFFDMAVDRSPGFQTQLGIKKDYGKWDDGSDERAHEDLELTKLNLLSIGS